MRWRLLFSSLLFGLIVQADGDSPVPTPAPALDAWPKTVETLAVALAENDPGALLSVLSDDKAIHTFDGKVTDAVRLLARTRRGALIGNFNYVYAPANMAGDIAESFRTSEVPEELKRRMALRDEAHARRANRTALTWLTESLQCKDGDKVGVLFFWCDKPANGEPPEVVFILVKADAEAQNTKIKTISFGNPTPPRAAK